MSSTEQWMLDEDPALREELKIRQAAAVEAVKRCPPPPVETSGRGIVICGGGLKYLPGLWVEVQILKKLGCQLPIEVWHLEEEMPEYFRELLKELGVETVDASALRSTKPSRILKGWELKAYAILHCSFREVLLLDADNVPVRDPSHLFDTAEFRRTGAIFWPDYRCLSPTRAIWEICGVEYRHEPEFETGQIVIDKVRNWLPLNLAMHYNEHSDFYYSHIHGDKETFHMAFRRLGVDYSMPTRGIHSLDATMCQHDFEGNRVFQHRNMAKWSLFGDNRRVEGFELEDDCLLYLEDLRKWWRPGEHGMRMFDWNRSTVEEIKKARLLCEQEWIYRRVGYDERLMTFSLDGLIKLGAARCEIFWNIVAAESSDFELVISSDESVTCNLKYNSDRWLGKWRIGECMPVELLRNDCSAE